MRRLWKFAGVMLLAMCVTPLSAQVALGLRFNRANYMLYEHIYACISIRNDSGKPLIFGDRPELQGFILFDVRDKNNRLVPRRKGQEFSAKGLYIAPGEIKNLVIQLDRYYDFKKEGVYYIHTYVSHNSIPREYRSQDAVLRISGGTAVWQKRVGLPSRTGEDQKMIERLYAIYKVEGDRVKHYYLRVEDDGKIYAVTRVGLVLSHMQFSAEVDMLSRIHLLMPVGPRVFHYMAFNADGMLFEDSYWKTSGTIPQLYRDPKTGKVTRLGGVVARKGVDYADPKSGSLTVSDLSGDDKKKPAPRKDSGIVDLGDGLMPEKSTDED